MNDRDLNDDIETIVEEGDLVYSLFWDSGGPGAGADYESVYKWNDQHFVALSYEDELQGPFETLQEAIEASELNYVNESTQEISSTELSASEIAVLLRTDQNTTMNGLTINDELWQLDAGGNFVRVAQ